MPHRGERTLSIHQIRPAKIVPSGGGKERGGRRTRKRRKKGTNEVKKMDGWWVSRNVGKKEGGKKWRYEG